MQQTWRYKAMSQMIYLPARYSYVSERIGHDPAVCAHARIQ